MLPTNSITITKSIMRPTGYASRLRGRSRTAVFFGRRLVKLASTRIHHFSTLATRSKVLPYQYALRAVKLLPRPSQMTFLTGQAFAWSYRPFPLVIGATMVFSTYSLKLWNPAFRAKVFNSCLGSFPKGCFPSGVSIQNNDAIVQSRFFASASRSFFSPGWYRHCHNPSAHVTGNIFTFSGEPLSLPVIRSRPLTLFTTLVFFDILSSYGFGFWFSLFAFTWFAGRLSREGLADSPCDALNFQTSTNYYEIQTTGFSLYVYFYFRVLYDFSNVIITCFECKFYVTLGTYLAYVFKYHASFWVVTIFVPQAYIMPNIN
jgi:hypothetical protein